MITLKQALALKYGDILYHCLHTNADGTPQRWRVNGQVKTWKRNPEAFRVPVKHGLNFFAYLDENNAQYLCLDEEDAKRKP